MKGLRAGGQLAPAAGLFAVLFGLGFLPLLGGPRYEAGLVAGLIAPLWSSCAGAFRARRQLALARVAEGERAGVGLLDLATAGLVTGALHGGVILLVALVHGLRVGFCEPGVGFVFLLLGACTGTALAGLWGALSVVASEAVARGWTPQRRWVSCLWTSAGALALPVGLALVGLLEFYFSPAVYAFSAFVGFFAGPLYETVNYPLVRLLTYRLGSAFSVVAVLSACFCLTWNGRKWGVRPSRRAALSLGLSAFIVTLALSLGGTALGHRSSADSIAVGLGGRVVVERCELIYDPSASSHANVLRLGRDCDAHLTQIGRYFGVHPPGHVRVYLFASERDKAHYVGVGHTYVAKPWRREIYLQESGFPHPALGHELAHIVAGEMGRGPFRVAGAAGGWFPDPGRIEGFAVAAAPREDSDATALEWASALLELEQLPALQRLFQLGFLGESAAKSYAVTGAFVEFVRQQHGPAALRAWYGGASLEEATGQPLAALDQSFRAALRQITPAPEVLAEAAQRFSTKAVFQRRCPHLVDRLAEQVEQCCALDAGRSLELAQTTLGYDSSRIDLLALQPRCLLLAGDAKAAGARAAELLKRPDWAPWQRRTLLERSGDAATARADWSGARAFYERALALTPSITGQRQLQVRLWALDQEDPLRSQILGFLSGGGEGAVSSALALGELGGSARDNPMVVYLLGRAYLSQGAAAEALPRLRAAAQATLPLPSVQREATRLWLVAAAQLERPGAVKEALEAVLRSQPGAAREFEARQLAERARAQQR